jgi:hypothetical protein
VKIQADRADHLGAPASTPSNAGFQFVQYRQDIGDFAFHTPVESIFEKLQSVSGSRFDCGHESVLVTLESVFRTWKSLWSGSIGEPWATRVSSLPTW